MSRLALPNRRPCERVRLEHDGQRYYATFSEAGGQVAEVFLQGGKSGTAIEAIARDSGVAVSLAFQHGASLQELQKSMTRDDAASAAGPMLAALDKIAKVLE